MTVQLYSYFSTLYCTYQNGSGDWWLYLGTEHQRKIPWNVPLDFCLLYLINYSRIWGLRTQPKKLFMPATIVGITVKTAKPTAKVSPKGAEKYGAGASIHRHESTDIENPGNGGQHSNCWTCISEAPRWRSWVCFTCILIASLFFTALAPEVASIVNASPKPHKNNPNMSWGILLRIFLFCNFK